MALIKTIAPKEASGEIGQAYDGFLKTLGMVPKPFQMYSASPGVLRIQGQVIQHFMNHPNLEFPLLTFIRYLCAEECTHDYCVDFNRNLLKSQGVGEADLEKAKQDAASAPLEEKDRQLLKFVLKAIRNPETTEQADVDALRDLGWTDSDIFDAVFHGAGMVVGSILMKAFKI